MPLFAAAAYATMATHEGGVTLPSGREFLFARYLDWSVTTPVLLLALSMPALHGAHRRAGLVARLIASDVVMIVTGLFFGAAEAPFSKWLWYVTSCVAFVAVCYVLFGPLRQGAMARDAERRAGYIRNLGILTVLWLLYPVVVILGPDQVQFWGATFTTACTTAIDLVAKVGYGFISMAGGRKVTDADLARGEVSPASISTHSVPSGADTGGVRQPVPVA